MKPPDRGVDLNAIAIFGDPPPIRESYDDLCPKKPDCAICPSPKDFKCKDTIASIYDLVANFEMKPVENRSFELFKKRELGKNCLFVSCEGSQRAYTRNPSITLFIFEFIKALFSFT